MQLQSADQPTSCGKNRMSTVKESVDQASRIAALFFSVVREAKAVFGTESRSDSSTGGDQREILSAISQMSRQLERSRISIEGAVDRKIEQDQYEKLCAAIRSMQIPLEMNNRQLIASSIPSLSEQVEQAKIRLEEGKQTWFKPWLAGESVRLIGLHAIIEDDGGRHALKRLAADFRQNVLDYSREVLESRSRMPWKEIADFVRGDNEAVLALLADDPADTRAGWAMVAIDEFEVRPESKVIEVRARVGQCISVGDILMVSETDKVTIEHSAKQKGIVKQVYVEVGAGLVAGQPIIALSLDVGA